MKKYILSTILALSLFGFLGFCIITNQNGDYRIYFPNRLPFVYQLHTSTPQEFIPAIEAGANEWTNLEACYFVFQRGANTNVSQVANDGVNLVYFDMQGVNFSDPNVIAFSSTFTTTVGGYQAVGSDLIWNGRDFTPGVNGEPNKMDLRSVITHEFGHHLGLNHAGQPPSPTSGSNGESYFYDFLIVAVGARHHYFGKDEWEKFAPGLKTLQDAINIRERILLAFEKAEKINDPDDQQKFLNFVIVGGGPTGVEMAGAIAEIAKKTLIEDFKKIDPSKAKIYLVEALPRILPSYPEELSQKAKEDLEKLGVKVLLNTRVTELTKNSVKLNGKEIHAATIIWAAGNKANPLIQQLNCELDKIGRAVVSPYLHLKDDENVFVIGDAAAVFDEKGNTLPGVSPVAITEGRYVAKFILKKLKNKKIKPYRYFDKGSLATIGKAKAVADFGWIRFSGFFAWLLWVFVHIFFLIGFKNRFIVMIEWIFAYFTYQKSARLIVSEKKLNGE